MRVFPNRQGAFAKNHPLGDIQVLFDMRNGEWFV
jgi:hypothetical protein